MAETWSKMVSVRMGPKDMIRYVLLLVVVVEDIVESY
jgi:hypothetical protein